MTIDPTNLGNEIGEEGMDATDRITRARLRRMADRVGAKEFQSRLSAAFSEVIDPHVGEQITPALRATLVDEIAEALRVLALREAN